MKTAEQELVWGSGRFNIYRDLRGSGYFVYEHETFCASYRSLEHAVRYAERAIIEAQES